MNFNLLPFCELDEDLRYPAITKPFRDGDWVYATDRRICVRVPANDELEPTEKAPKADRIFNDFKTSACTEPWPKWDGQRQHAQCRECEDEEPEQIAPQRIAGRLIAGLYWFKVANLGDVLFSPQSCKHEPLHFVCGDLQGILMPMRQDE